MFQNLSSSLFIATFVVKNEGSGIKLEFISILGFSISIPEINYANTYTSLFLQYCNYIFSINTGMSIISEAPTS